MPCPSGVRRLRARMLPFTGNRPCALVPDVGRVRSGLHSLPFKVPAMSERLFEALALYLVLSILFKD
jgi:hypothetical protein